MCYAGRVTVRMPCASGIIVKYDLCRNMASSRCYMQRRAPSPYVLCRGGSVQRGKGTASIMCPKIQVTGVLSASTNTLLSVCRMQQRGRLAGGCCAKGGGQSQGGMAPLAYFPAAPAPSNCWNTVNLNPKPGSEPAQLAFQRRGKLSSVALPGLTQQELGSVREDARLLVHDACHTHRRVEHDRQLNTQCLRHVHASDPEAA